MRKTIKLLLLLVMAIVCQGAWGQDPQPQQPSGEGTMENPYLIGTIDELFWYHDHADGVAAKLTADIDLAGINWVPISSKMITEKSGYVYFNGDGHTISNLKVEGSYTYGGLFGYIRPLKDYAIAVENLTLENPAIHLTEGSYSGALCGSIYRGRFEHITVINPNIIQDSGSDAGGIVGSADNGHFRVCKVIGGTIRSRGNVGGIAGYLRSSVNASQFAFVSCSNSADIYCYGFSHYINCAGGIVGYAVRQSVDFNHAYITTCINHGRIESDGVAGGICGTYNFAEAENQENLRIELCLNDGIVPYTNEMWNYTEDGKIDGLKEGASVGKIIGYSNNPDKLSYAGCFFNDNPRIFDDQIGLETNKLEQVHQTVWESGALTYRLSKELHAIEFCQRLTGENPDKSPELYYTKAERDAYRILKVTYEQCFSGEVLSTTYCNPDGDHTEDYTLLVHTDGVEHHDAVPATCIEMGMIEYWYCPDCDAYSLDEAFTQSIKPTETETLPLGHDISDDGYCTRCHEKVVFGDGDNSITIPKCIHETLMYKYTATKTGTLTIELDPSISVADLTVMRWSELEDLLGTGQDSQGAKKRNMPKRSPERFSLTVNVVEGMSYAILIDIENVEEDVQTILSLSYITNNNVLTVGENIIDIAANDNQPNRNGWFDNEDAFQQFTFTTPCSGELFISDVTENSRQQLAMYINDRINHTSSNELPTYMYVENIEQGTYTIGIREFYGQPVRDAKIRIDLFCQNHRFDENGKCQTEGCTKQIEHKPFILAIEDTDGEVTEIPLAEAINIQDLEENQYIASEVFYKRNTTTSRWGTVILPYELQSNDMVTYYQLVSTEGTNEGETAVMTFSPVETVRANTPIVYRFNREAREYQYDASTTEPTSVVLPRDYKWLETSVEGLREWTMCGFYEQHIINSNDNIQNYRYISKDKFMTASNTLTINPYRAVFRVGRAASAKTFVIAIADGGTTSIQAVATANGVEEVIGIYDINGRQLNTMQRGVNIIRTADGKTHKIINK